MNWMTRMMGGQQQQRPGTPPQGQQMQGQMPPQGGTPPAGGPDGQPQPSQDPFGSWDLFGRTPGAQGQQGQVQGQMQQTGQQQQMQQQQQPQGQPQPPAYNGYLAPWNPQNMNQVLGQMDFMQGMNPEIMQKLTGGDLSVLPEMLNHVARSVTARTLQTAHTWVDTGVNNGLDKFRGGMDDYLRDWQIRTDNVEDPALSHPQVAPVYQSIKSYIASSNPQLSPQEVNKQARAWFDNFGKLTQQQQQQVQQTQNPGPAEPNWAANFGIAPPQQQSQQQMQAPQGQGAQPPGQ